jgi:hypothetical protein
LNAGAHSSPKNIYVRPRSRSLANANAPAVGSRPRAANRSTANRSALGLGAPWLPLAYVVRSGARPWRSFSCGRSGAGVCLARFPDSCGRIFQLGIRKNKKYLDAVCMIVYICVCGGGMFPRPKKGRSKMITVNLSEKDFNKIADVIEQRILYYHSLAMNARIVDDEKQFLKQMEKVSFYTRLKTVFLGEKI